MSALSERTLAVLRVMDKHIVTANEHSCGCGLDPGLIHVADEILAALNEACTIRTVEQLDALPQFTVVRDRNKTVWEKEDHGSPGSPWWETGSERNRASWRIRLDALLIWHPDWARP